jgi:hypothetical protein
MTRGHENPSDAQFCGQCGPVDLTETAGARPWGIYPLKLLVIVILGSFLSKKRYLAQPSFI